MGDPLRCALGAAFALSLLGAGCSGPAVAAPPPLTPAATSGAPVSFSYETVDGKALSTASVAGRITVMGFITTYDVASQAEVRFLIGLGRTHAPRLNVAFVVLERQENRPLIDAFVAALGIPYPVALADTETIEGQGPFAGLHHVPSVVILDRQGREVWRYIGLVKEAELEQAVRAVEQSAPAP